MPWLLLCLLIAACSTPPRRDADLDRCLATMRWLDRIEGEHQVWIDADGVEHLVANDARAPPEGAVEIDGRPSPTCAARVRAYGRALRDGRARRASDSASEALLW